MPVCLAKMGPEDNPEAFLITFEWVALAAKWPPEQWATLLAQCLTDLAQAVKYIMDSCLRKLKTMQAVILDALDISPEIFWQ